MSRYFWNIIRGKQPLGFVGRGFTKCSWPWMLGQNQKSLSLGHSCSKINRDPSDIWFFSHTGHQKLSWIGRKMVTSCGWQFRPKTPDQDFRSRLHNLTIIKFVFLSLHYSDVVLEMQHHHLYFSGHLKGRECKLESVIKIPIYSPCDQFFFHSQWQYKLQSAHLEVTHWSQNTQYLAFTFL